MPAKKYQSIPTNIITGFLGVGKTTAIRHLLKTKPANEKWAVLVNEFGEVGIDGALLNADGIAVKEVPGGCMCCSVGLPSRVALNNLIRQHNPDRILIEPTGLAHPRQVLEMFSGKEYETVLDLRAVVCLVDPWCINDPQFMDLPAFRDQIAMADVLVATKVDIADSDHLQAFRDFVGLLQPAKARVDEIAGGELDWQSLNVNRETHAEDQQVHHHHTHHNHTAETKEPEPEPDKEGVIRIENASDLGDGEKGYSCGWRFSSEWQFDLQALLTFIDELSVPRVKGVFNTEQGCYAINKMRQVVSSEAMKAIGESRIEMISMEPVEWLELDRALRECRA